VLSSAEEAQLQQLEAMILVSGRFKLAIGFFRRVARLKAECLRHFHDARGLPPLATQGWLEFDVR
jgi:hypothetical protein